MSIHEMGGVEAPADVSHVHHGTEPYRPVFVGARRQELDELLTRYPTKMAALLPALWMVQHDRGWVSDDAMAEVATQRPEKAVTLLRNSKPRGAWLWFYFGASDLNEFRKRPDVSELMAELDPRR